MNEQPILSPEDNMFNTTSTNDNPTGFDLIDSAVQLVAS